MLAASTLIVSPVRNEAAHIERMARSMAAQTVVPRRWVVLDDGSTDDTWAILVALQREMPFLAPKRTTHLEELASTRDRLAAAAAPRAFNEALQGVDTSQFEFIGKFDGDLELPPDYFERLLERFAADAGLGIASGDLIECFNGEWRRIAIPPHHVPGATKLYRRDCFEAIGGLRNTLGWDTIDEVTARAIGYRTRSYREIVVKHHRHWGSANGTLRGRARHGRAAWILGYDLGWTVLRSLKLMTVRPIGVSGLAFLLGYLEAAVGRGPRADEAFRVMMRSELRARLRIRSRPPAAPASVEPVQLARE